MLSPQSNSSGEAGQHMEPRFFKDTAPTWEQLEAMVLEKQRKLDYSPPDLENGPANAKALLRLFGTTQPEAVQVKLYRDHAAWCPYCHKIVLQLEEKRIPYSIEKINMRCYGDKPFKFLQKVRSGLLPVLEYKGRVITESASIAALLEEEFPQNRPLLPPKGTREADRATQLMRLERKLFSDWLQWLCSSEKAKAGFMSTVDLIDVELGKDEGPYFLSDFSLVDITFAPFLERIAASIFYYKDFRVRGDGRWPNVEKWFDAMESRPSYAGFKSDYYTHAHDLPPQLGGCLFSPNAKVGAGAVDGTDGKSWHLPLESLSSTSTEPHSLGDDPELDRLVAAARLVSNREAVTKFALRGAGKRGPRPVSAPLCDPTALPALEFTQEMEAALRLVAFALLTATESVTVETADAAARATSSEEYYDASPIIPSLAYIRDRVCVPRDLSFPSARQFRAHMNWMMDSLM